MAFFDHSYYNDTEKIDFLIRNHFWDMDVEDREYAINEHIRRNSEKQSIFSSNNSSIEIYGDDRTTKEYSFTDNEGLEYSQDGKTIILDSSGLVSCSVSTSCRIPIIKDINEEEVNKIKATKREILKKYLRLISDSNSDERTKEYLDELYWDELRELDKKLVALGPGHIDYYRDIEYQNGEYTKKESLVFINIEPSKLCGFENPEGYEIVLNNKQTNLSPDEEILNDDILSEIGELYEIDYKALTWPTHPDGTIREWLIDNNTELDLALKVYEARYDHEFNKDDFGKKKPSINK